MILERIRRTRQEYPIQFWLLFVGMIISRTGASMTWPFMTVYISAQLDLPLTSVATLFTINSAMGLIASFVAGPITDRAGRKGAMVVSLLGSGLSFVGMVWARSYGAFAVLMALRGALSPLYQVGSNAMLADMLPPEKRDDGYATLRMGSNLGIALGPALGGVIISQSYTITFSLAAAGMAIFGLLILFQARETKPASEAKSERHWEPWGGYPQVLRDGRFLTMILSLTLAMVPVTIMWTLLAVHATRNYGLSESQFGLIPTTNAALVVALQILVTRYTKRQPPFWMLALGALLYGLGVGSVALGRGFWGFWASMVIVTCGELILMPTAATYAANLAPPDMRGRYMSIYSLAWTVAFAIGPVVGSFLNDDFGPMAIWYGAAAFGLFSALSFVRLALAAIRDKRGAS